MSFPFNRTCARCALVGAVSLFSLSVRAADRFPVTPAQLQALGITLQRLDQPSVLRGLVYPARVVLPPQQEFVISAPVAGVVHRVLVAEHDVLQAGQPLLLLSSPDFGALQLEALEAANKHRLTQQTLEREKQLFAEGIVPQRRALEAEAAASDARGRLDHAKAALRLAGVDEGSLTQLIERGKLLDSLTLRARSAGIVVELSAKPGQRVAPADPLAQIADPSHLWLDIQLPADKASAWAKDGEIAVVGRAATATAVSLGAMVSEGQSVSLRADVTRGVELLRPGEFVQAQVPFAGTADAWTLPISAVSRQGEHAYVFARTADGFEAREVTVVASAAQSVSVTGPLVTGDQVAVTSTIALKAAWLGESGGE